MKKIIKIISICLCIAVLGSGAVSATKNDENDIQNNEILNDVKVNTEESIPYESPYKDETVYVLTSADGAVEKIIVSDWIKNTNLSDKIKDVSELQNIENIKGDEGYVLGGDNTRVWDAKGNDIYYQGTIEKELPVKLLVSYKLDGKTIPPEELIGKSGKVTIRFDYENNQYEMINIKGNDEKIYVPFVMMTGLIFDNNKFSNIEVSNGKLINDGDRTAVIGFALPGLKEDLNIDIEDIEIPSYVEITADTNNFSLDNTVTVATNALFNNIDAEKINSVSDLTDSMDKLKNAMTKLIDGSSSLYDGLCTLLNKSSELINGINQLANGAAKQKDGANTLDKGAKKVSDGVETLSNGLNTLTANNDNLNTGAKKVFESLLSNAESQLKAAGLSVPTLTIDNYALVLNKIIDSVEDAREIIALKASLDNYNTFYQGLINYTIGVKQAASGASELKKGTADLKNGTSSLYNGANQLYEGILTMKNGAPALVSGITQLKDGAMQLSEGLSQFNKEGINKIISSVDDSEELIDRIKATINVSKNYKSFAGISEDSDGNVKFIYRTAEIK